MTGAKTPDFNIKFVLFAHIDELKHKKCTPIMVIGVHFLSAKIHLADMEYIEDFYDEIWIPDELHGVHFKNAITKRNEWFVNNSDLLIAYVLRNKGGAATCLKMAEKQKILTVNIADNKDIY